MGATDNGPPDEDIGLEISAVKCAGASDAAQIYRLKIKEGTAVKMGAAPCRNPPRGARGGK